MFSNLLFYYIFRKSKYQDTGIAIFNAKCYNQIYCIRIIGELCDAEEKRE